MIMKKLCKQEVIGIRMHQFKVSGLNSVHLICNSYFNFWFNMFKHQNRNHKLSLYAIQTTYLELMHSYPYCFLFTQLFHHLNFDPYSSSLKINFFVLLVL